METTYQATNHIKKQKYQPSKTKEKTKSRYNPIETIDDLRKKANKSKTCFVGQGFEILANDLKLLLSKFPPTAGQEYSNFCYTNSDFITIIKSYKNPIKSRLEYAYRTLRDFLAEYGIILHSGSASQFKPKNKIDILAKCEYKFILGEKLNNFIAAFSTK